MRGYRQILLIMATFIIAILTMATFLALMESGQPKMAQAAPPPRPPAYTVIDTDTTWGPEVVTVTSDVVVKNGATLTVLPGTEVRIFTDTNPYPGGVSDLIEIIVEPGGRLVAVGTSTQTITFTSGIEEGQWWGIRILGSGAGGAG
ncbi:MAG TPA: hypothetical protein ENG33_09115, partial [Chloroflexi bacterium]|nr:hypothetical protein [Chloroflexota bacterium]